MTLNVSRETTERLEIYVALLKKWTQRINLIAKSTVPHIWDRHIMDSLHLVPLAPPTPSHWVDLGTGAGLPGMVAAIALAETSPETTVTLIDGDERKCAFLAAAIRETGVAANVLASRIEDAPTPECRRCFGPRAGTAGPAAAARGKAHRKRWRLSLSEGRTGRI